MSARRTGNLQHEQLNLSGCSVQPTNILLNEHMEAKVSDFGLSRFIAMDESDVVTEVRGTTGYMDPEYINAGTLTFASDVYSLGVVMLQLISGRKPIFNFGLDGQHPYSLVKAVMTQRLKIPFLGRWPLTLINAE